MSNSSQPNKTLPLKNESEIHHDEVNQSEAWLILGFLGLLGFCIVVANSLVLFLYWRKPLLRKKSNTVLISLAVSDLLTGLLVIPLIISCNLSDMYAQTVTYCFAMDIGERFLFISTILHLFAATMERYLRILKPLQSIAMVTKRRIVCTLSLIWCFSFAASVVQLSWTYSDKAMNIDVVYSMTVLCVLVLLPFVIMVFAFIHMFVAIRRKKAQLSGLVEDSQRAAKRHNRRKVEKRSVVVYSAMAFTYAIGWFPFSFVINIAYFEQHYSSPFWLDIIIVYIKYTTSLVNPVLYTFFKSDFQTALRSLNITNSSASNNPATSQFRLNPMPRLGAQATSP